MDTAITINNTEMEQIASELQGRISLLCNFSGESLKGEMGSLKKALLENPAACSLLLEEDIGRAVAALRRMVGAAVTTAVAAKEKKPAKVKSKALTPEELKAQLSLISDSDF